MGGDDSRRLKDSWRSITYVIHHIHTAAQALPVDHLHQSHRISAHDHSTLRTVHPDDGSVVEITNLK